jgi:hypothetical protein
MLKRFFQRLRKKADVPLVEASETKKIHPMSLGNMSGHLMKHEMLYWNLYFLEFQMKSYYVYLNYFLCLIYVTYHWFVDGLKWSPIQMKFGN